MNVSEMVTQTVATGVTPIELGFKAVRNCRTGNPVGYRAELAVNSVALGHISESEYSKVSDSLEIGLRLTDRAIEKALTATERFARAKRHPAWISVRCPIEYAEAPDFYERVKKLLGDKDRKGHAALCLEFSDKLLSSGADVGRAMLDLKLLGVKSMIVCEDADTTPFFKLVEIPADYILLTAKMTAMVSDRNKPAVLAALTQYLQSVGVGVIATGARNTEEVRTYARLEYVGYVPDGETSVPFSEAVVQKEDSD